MDIRKRHKQTRNRKSWKRIRNTNNKTYKKNNPRVIVGHDYRSYSEEIKTFFKKGLISTGCSVEDIGLSLSPTVYFAQFNLNADAVAMITASHNENGWTGVKMGIQKGLTHTPDEMKELKAVSYTHLTLPTNREV